MSPKYSRLIASLTALGLLGLAATRTARSAEPPPSPVPTTSTAPSHTERVLLKSDGNILRGMITEEDGKYVVRQRGGEIRVKKFDVEQVFDSLADVYRYKRSLVPVTDPDEHLKLAKWCLTKKLLVEAKAEIQTVLALTPKMREAKAMLTSIEATEARQSNGPRVDDGIVRTGVEMSARLKPQPITDAPSQIDPSVLQRARRELGVSTVPVIFDLPPTLAVKRAETFAQLVHPVLQASCVRCHDESYEGNFQLIQVRSRKGMTANVLRTNLDATLRLVDPDDPSKSELLSSALLPHGRAPARHPIFRGSNDSRFKILSAWVNSLRADSGRTAAGGRFADPAQRNDGMSFASERGLVPAGSSVSPVPMSNPVKPFDFGDRRDVLPPSRFVPGRGFVQEKMPPAADEFPVPFAAGGPVPKRDGALSPATATLPTPGSTPSLPPLPGNAPATRPRSKQPAKPVKIDPALLEKAILNQNAGR